MATKMHIPRQNTHALKEISVSIIIALFFKILFSAQMALLFFFYQNLKFALEMPAGCMVLILLYINKYK